MNTKTIIKSFIISTLFIYVVLIAGKVYSNTLEISGNASDSNNSININQTESTTINQSNSANVNNSVNANSDTGGNSINDSVGGGSITTGNATSNVNINNQFNSNTTNPTPTPKPSPTPSPTPTHQVGGPTTDPTSSPTPIPSKSNEKKDGGSTSGSSSGDPGQGGAVLGLSSTSGEQSLFKIIPGLISILLGLNLIRLSPRSFGEMFAYRGSKRRG